MSEIIKKPLTGFILFCLSHAKPESVPEGALLPCPLSEVGAAGAWEYLYGTTGHKITRALLNTKYDLYYGLHGWTREEYDETTQGFVGRTACDCQGLQDNHCGTDINANTNYRSCTGKGEIDPDAHYDIGECFFKAGSEGKMVHVGWVCGYMPDGEELVVEERGIRYGCVVTRRSEREWTHHGKSSKYLDYSEPVALYVPEPVVFAPGDAGPQVAALQTFLAGMNYTDADGAPLVIDGKLGAKTWQALSAFVSAHIDTEELQSTTCEAQAILELPDADRYTICVFKSADLHSEGGE